MTEKPDSHSALNGVKVSGSEGATNAASEPNHADLRRINAMADTALTPPAGDRQHVPTEQAAPETFTEVPLVEGQDEHGGAFDRGLMSENDIDNHTLIQALVNTLKPFGMILKDGHGVALVLRADGNASIIGVKIGGCSMSAVDQAAPELLPCPFCGGKGRRLTLPRDEFDNEGGDVIECSGCLASSRVEFGRKENLNDAWNRRADLAAPNAPAEVEGLVERIKFEAVNSEIDRKLAGDITTTLTSLQATIARLTAELEAEKAKRGAQLENIALWHDENASHSQGGLDYSDAVGIPISNRTELTQSVKSHEYSARHIRALDPDATAALAEMLDAETRACAEICDRNDQVSGWVSRDAILARLDQRKEAE